jgi:hypothetical protein
VVSRFAEALTRAVERTAPYPMRRRNGPMTIAVRSARYAGTPVYVLRGRPMRYIAEGREPVP